jgi:hypothetical protein
MSVRAIYKYILTAISRPFHPPTKSQSRHTSTTPSTCETSDAGEDKQAKFDIPIATCSTRRMSILQAEAVAEARLNEHEGDITYRERLGGWLHPRDMRRLVTPFSASNEPGLIVRRHVMLLNFDPLRAIILRNRLLVL